MTGPSDKPLFSPYIRGSLPTEISPQRYQRLCLSAFPSAPQWRLTSSAISSHVAKLAASTVDPSSRYCAPSLGSSGRSSCPGLCHFHLPLYRTGKLSDSFVRWLAWSCDAIDFFSVSLSVTRLQQQFHKAEASTIVRCPHLAYSPFAPPLRMNVDAVTVYPDASHHVDASIPVCRRRKCFLVTCVCHYWPICSQPLVI